MSETQPRYDVRPSYRVDVHLNPKGTIGPPLRSIDCHAASPVEAANRAIVSLRETARQSGKWVMAFRVTVRDADTHALPLDCPESFRV